MLISKVGAEHYEQKKNHNGRTAYGFRAGGRYKNPGGKGASSNVVGIICPPSTLVLIVTLFAKI